MESENSRFEEIVRRVEISINPATQAQDITLEQVLGLMKKIGTTHQERLAQTSSKSSKQSPLSQTHQAVQDLRTQKNLAT